MIITGITLALEPAVITEIGVQFKCIITDYLSKDKPTETLVTLFHLNGSRFTNQTTAVKRESTVFFSGALILIDDKFYLELQNFNFLHGHQSLTTSTSVKQIPWSNFSKTLSTNTTTITTARAIYKKSQQTHTQPKTSIKPKNTRSPSQIQPNPQDIQTIDDDDPFTFSTSITPEIIQQSTPQPIPQCKTRSAA